MERNEQQGLAFIRTVTSLTPIENADNIETAHVLGWTVVVKKGTLQPNDKVVYFEIDTLLPLDNKHFEFLKPRGCRLVDGKEYHRLKTAKLRGQISQGLIVKASDFNFEHIEEGTDVTTNLNLLKYEKPSIGVKGNTGTKVSSTAEFPSYLGFGKTDETRIQNAPDYLRLWKGKDVVGTVKMDGTSSTYFLNKNEKYSDSFWFRIKNRFLKLFGKEIKPKIFGICSRNIFLNKKPNSYKYEDVYGKIALKYDMEKILNYLFHKTGNYYCFQGEICGDGIQGNPLKLKQGEHELFIFNVYNITKQEYLTHEEQTQLVIDCGLKNVPVTFDGKFEFSTTEELLKFAEGKYDSGVIREGVVFRLKHEPYQVGGRRNSFKVVSNSYLMKFEND